jgi:hypothetical protein
MADLYVFIVENEGLAKALIRDHFRKSPQVDRIIEIIERDGRSDNFRCIRDRMSLRLGARIWDLKHRGYKIRTEERPDKNTVIPLDR